MPFIVTVLVALILIFPAWKIFSKAGFHPALSLLLFIPFFGLTVAVIVLAFADWPALRNQPRARG